MKKYIVIMMVNTSYLDERVAKKYLLQNINSYIDLDEIRDYNIKKIRFRKIKDRSSLFNVAWKITLSVSKKRKKLTEEQIRKKCDILEYARYKKKEIERNLFYKKYVEDEMGIKIE